VGAFALALSTDDGTTADDQLTETTLLVSGPCTAGAAEPCGIDAGDGLALATNGAEIVDNGDGTATVTGDIEIVTESGPIDIDNAELIIEVPPDGGPPEIIGGTGDVPFPTIGFLSEASLIGTSTGLFGVDYGRDLERLGAFLNPDTKYLWVTFSNGMDVSTGFADMFPGIDTSGLPESFNVPLGVQATMVIDPADPYVYISGACPEFPDHDDQEDNEDDTNTTSASSTTTTLPDDDAPITIEPEDDGVGDDCGIGFSLSGEIPFTPSDVDGLPESVKAYAGHIVIRGEVPLGGTGLVIDGVTVQRFETSGYRLDGYGDVAVTMPFIQGLIDVEIPMGDAAAGMTVTDRSVEAYAAGSFGGSQEPLILPLPIPIEIPNEQSASTTISASIGGSTGVDGVFRIDPDSSLVIAGRQGVGLSTFGNLLGVELADTQTTTGTLILDRNGAFLEAKTSDGIHPSIDFGTGTKITARIDAESLDDSFIEAVGQMTFAAVTLEGESLLRIDRSGIQALGTLGTSLGGVEMAGSIGPDGVDLRGRTDLRFPVSVTDRLAADVDDALAAAIAEVERIDDEIERISAEIRAERRERSSDFKAAKNAFDDAQAEVDKINDDITANKSTIAATKKKIADVCKGKSGLALTACKVTNGPKIVAWNAEIAALKAANAGLVAAREIATVTLDAASIVLDEIEAGLDAIPIDADPRIIALAASRDTALGVLVTTRTLAGAVDNTGTIGGSVELRIGTGGLGGDADIEWCDASGCTTLAGATIQLDNRFLACVTLFGVPDICAEF